MTPTYFVLLMRVNSTAVCVSTRTEMRIHPAGHATGEDTTYTSSLCPRKAQASRCRLVSHDLNLRERALSRHWKCRSMTVTLETILALTMASLTLTYLTLTFTDTDT